MCQADCKPDCTYRWVNQSASTLTFDPVSKEDHGTYTCVAYNKHNPEGIRTQFVLTVNYIPEIVRFAASSDSATQSATLGLTCDVTSRPVSDVIIKYKSNGTVLTSQRGQRVQYIFTSVQCLDTGVYTCSANNGIGENDVTMDLYVNVKCSFSPVSVTETVVKTLGEAFTFAHTMTANPFPDITRRNLTFQYKNGTTEPVSLHQNIDIAVLATDHDVRKQLVFRVWALDQTNYGVYTVTASNDVGPPAILQITIEPQGPPTVPSKLRLLYATAVSLNLQWTAGFNGGFPQTFTVMYINQKTGQEHSQWVTTDPDVSSGDVVSHKIQDFITPDTNYTLWIKAENQFEEKSEVAGPPGVFTSDPASGFVENARPEVSLDSEREQIQVDLNLLNPEYLTSVVCEVCTTDNPATCNSTNHTDLSVQEVVVPLPDSTVQEYFISVYMYDREDAVFNDTWRVSFHYKGVSKTIVVACSITSVVVIVIVIILMVLWRTGKLRPKAKSSDRPRNNHKDEIYENVGFSKSADPQSDGLQYEDVRDYSRQQENTQEDTGTYESLSQSNMIKTSAVYQSVIHNTQASKRRPNGDINFRKLISEGHCFSIFSAQTEGNPNKRIIVKQLAESHITSTVYKEYLRGCAELYDKVSSRHVIKCLRQEPGLVMENAPLGNLRNYLEGTRTNDSMSTRDHVRFIQHVAEGLKVVSQLEPRALFYCLSSEHVLLTANKICKLTGFCKAENVREREKWEEKNGLPRPVRWLAPEAIRLNHVPQSDIWGFGVLVWEILSYGELPYKSLDDDHILEHICKLRRLEMPDNCPDYLFDILTQCWLSDPDERIRVLKICRVLNNYDNSDQSI